MIQCARASKALSAVACCMVLLLTGCEPGRFYARDRAADFADIWRANVAVGPGLGIVGFATQYLRAGAIFSHGEHAGMVGREVGFWNEGRLEAELILTGNNGLRITPRAWSTVRRGSRDNGWERNPLLGIRGHVWQINWYDFRWGREPEVSGPAEFGLRAHMLVVGGEAGVRLDEIVDFVAGLWGADPCGDDSWTELQKSLSLAQKVTDRRTFVSVHESILAGKPGEPFASDSVQALLDTAAWAEQAGDVDLAMCCYETILAASPSEAARLGADRIESDPHLHVALLLQRGRQALARAQTMSSLHGAMAEESRGRAMLEKVIELAPGTPEAEEAQRLLEGIPDRRVPRDTEVKP